MRPGLQGRGGRMGGAQSAHLAVEGGGRLPREESFDTASTATNPGRRCLPESRCLSGVSPSALLAIAQTQGGGQRGGASALVGSVLRGMSARDAGHRSYPYPRHHSTLVLLPRGTQGGGQRGGASALVGSVLRGMSARDAGHRSYPYPRHHSTLVLLPRGTQGGGQRGGASALVGSVLRGMSARDAGHRSYPYPRHHSTLVLLPRGTQGGGQRGGASALVGSVLRGMSARDAGHRSYPYPRHHSTLVLLPRGTQGGGQRGGASALVGSVLRGMSARDAGHRSYPYPRHHSTLVLLPRGTQGGGQRGGASALVGSVLRGMSARDAGHRSYPYPRHHSTLVLLPSGGVAAPIPPPRPVLNFPSRPPLNRACPTIPESRSDDSLRTGSSLSASRHRLQSPSTPDASVVIQNHVAPLFEEVASPRLDQRAELRSPRTEPRSPRLDTSRSSDSVGEGPSSMSSPPPVKSVSSPQIARKVPSSPLLLAASKVRSKLEALSGRFGQRSLDSGSRSPSIGRQQSSLPPSVQPSPLVGKKRTASLKAKISRGLSPHRRAEPSRHLHLPLSPPKEGLPQLAISDLHQEPQPRPVQPVAAQPKDKNDNVPKAEDSVGEPAKQSKIPLPGSLGRSRPPWRGAGKLKAPSKPHLPFHFRSKAKPKESEDRRRSSGSSSGRSPLLGRKSPSPSAIRRVAPQETTVQGLPKLRPNHLLGLKPKAEVLPAPRLRSPQERAAPLAESESSTIENSPAVEIAPGPFPTRGPVVGGLRRGSIPRSPLADPCVVCPSGPMLPSGLASVPTPPSGLASGMSEGRGSCCQATRPLDSSSPPLLPQSPHCSSTGQRALGASPSGVHSDMPVRKASLGAGLQRPTPPPKPVVLLRPHIRLASPSAEVERSWLGALSSPLIREEEERPAGAEHKKALGDAGALRCTSSPSSAAESSKVTSPSSEHRGLIDDEIRDQPDLLSLETASSASPATPADAKRADFASLVQIKNTSHDLSASIFSTASTLDGEESALDYELGVSVDLAASVDLGSPLQRGASLRRSSRLRSQRRTSGVVKSCASQRDSLDIAMDELKNIVSHISMEADAAAAAVESAGDTLLRPPTTPAQTTLAPVPIDPHLYRSMCQDLTVVKTLLLRLKTELSKAETSNPFAASLSSGESLPEEPAPSASTAPPSPPHPPIAAENHRLAAENGELRAEIAELRAQLALKEESLKRIHQASLQVHRQAFDHPDLQAQTLDPQALTKPPAQTNGMDTAV